MDLNYAEAFQDYSLPTTDNVEVTAPLSACQTLDVLMGSIQQSSTNILKKKRKGKQHEEEQQSISSHFNSSSVHPQQPAALPSLEKEQSDSSKTQSTASFQCQLFGLEQQPEAVQRRMEQMQLKITELEAERDRLAATDAAQQQFVEQVNAQAREIGHLRARIKEYQLMEKAFEDLKKDRDLLEATIKKAMESKSRVSVPAANDEKKAEERVSRAMLQNQSVLEARIKQLEDQNAKMQEDNQRLLTDNERLVQQRKLIDNMDAREQLAAQARQYLLRQKELELLVGEQDAKLEQTKQLAERFEQLKAASQRQEGRQAELQARNESLCMENARLSDLLSREQAKNHNNAQQISLLKSQVQEAGQNLKRKETEIQTLTETARGEREQRLKAQRRNSEMKTLLGSLSAVETTQSSLRVI